MTEVQSYRGIEHIQNDNQNSPFEETPYSNPDRFYSYAVAESARQDKMDEDKSLEEEEEEEEVSESESEASDQEYYCQLSAQFIKYRNKMLGANDVSVTRPSDHQSDGADSEVGDAVELNTEENDAKVQRSGSASNDQFSSEAEENASVESSKSQESQKSKNRIVSANEMSVTRPAHQSDEDMAAEAKHDTSGMRDDLLQKEIDVQDEFNVHIEHLSLVESEVGVEVELNSAKVMSADGSMDQVSLEAEEISQNHMSQEEDTKDQSKDKQSDDQQFDDEKSDDEENRIFYDAEEEWYHYQLQVAKRSMREMDSEELKETLEELSIVKELIEQDQKLVKRKYEDMKIEKNVKSWVNPGYYLPLPDNYTLKLSLFKNMYKRLNMELWKVCEESRYCQQLIHNPN